MAVEQQIGPYRVVETIAEGRFGRMLLAKNPNGEKVAVKCLKLDLLIDDKALEMFEREMGVLTSLSHPAVPRLLDCGVAEGGGPYLVQQYIEGLNLAQAVKQGRRFSNEQAEELARRLLGALDYLHGLHPPVIHRDLKPANIILSKNGPVIVDFGAVAGKALLKDEIGDTVVGTFGYMAPESLKGRMSPSSDLYSLGATLLFAFSGREPETFPTERLRIRFRDILNLPSQLANLLEALLEPVIEDRPQTAREALEILDRPAGRPVAPGTKALALRSSKVELLEGSAAKPALSSRKRTLLKVVSLGTGLTLVALFFILGPTVFLAWVRVVFIGGAIILLIVLILLTFIGF